MDTNHLGDTLSGLLLFHGSKNSNNDREDCSRTPTNNGRDVTPASNDMGPNPTSNDIMVVTCTPPIAVIKTKRQKYTKRGGTSFEQKKRPMKANYRYQATDKPHAAKQSANVAISALWLTLPAIKMWLRLTFKKKQKLIHLYYIKIGSPPPEEKTGTTKAGQY